MGLLGLTTTRRSSSSAEQPLPIEVISKAQSQVRAHRADHHRQTIAFSSTQRGHPIHRKLRNRRERTRGAGCGEVSDLPHPTPPPPPTTSISRARACALHTVGTSTPPLWLFSSMQATGWITASRACLVATAPARRPRSPRPMAS